MDIGEIQKQIADQFGACVGPVIDGGPSSWIEVDADKVDRIAEFLKSSPDLKLDVLSNLSGADYPQHGHIQIVYHLISYELGHDVVIKVNADRDDPKVQTVERVWPTANWLEREVYDLLGVEFVGHTDLRRILLPDDWVGHPLRKDYVEAPDYHGISTVRESMLNIPGRE